MEQMEQQEPANEKPNTWLILIFLFAMVAVAHYLATLMSKAACQLLGREHTSQCNWIGWTVIFAITCMYGIYELATIPDWMLNNSHYGNAQIFGILSIFGLIMSIRALVRAPRIGEINSDERTVTLDHTN